MSSILRARIRYNLDGRGNKELGEHFESGNISSIWQTDIKEQAKDDVQTDRDGNFINFLHIILRVLERAMQNGVTILCYGATQYNVQLEDDNIYEKEQFFK